MFLTRFFQFQFRRNIQHLVLHVTSDCNLRCGHCFCGAAAGPDLPLERCRELGKELGRILWLDIGGGEPFLREDLAELVAGFDAEIVQIPTNGTMPERIAATALRMARKGKAKPVISVSIDGFEEDHDTMRGERGTWAKAWKTFEALKNSGIAVKINTVLTTSNSTRMLEFMSYVRTRDPAFHSIVFHRGMPADRAFRLPDTERIREFAPAAWRILDTYDYGRNRLAAHLLRNYQRHLWKTSMDILEEKRQVVPCLAGQAHMVVFSDGSVSPCEMLPHTGSIIEKPLARIVREEPFRRRLASIRRGECFCTHNCALLDSVLFRPGSLFPLLRGRRW